MGDRPVSENRWLTNVDKEFVLVSWNEAKVQPVPEGDSGGVGYLIPILYRGATASTRYRASAPFSPARAM